MTLVVQEIVECIEVLADNTIQYCVCRQVVDSDAGNAPVGGPERWRYSLSPNAPLAGVPQKVQDVANSVWTPA